MNDNQQPETSELDILIDQLPEQFPAAVESIKHDIAPHLIECNPGLRDHFIKLIKKRTHAASIKSVAMLIDEAIKEINGSDSGDNENAIQCAPEDPEIIDAADQIANDPLLFKNKIDIVNQLGVINERKNIGLYQLVIDSRVLPLGSAGSDALAIKNSGHYGAGKSFPLFSCLKLYSERACHLISSGSEKSLYSIEGGLKHKALILAEALTLESNGRKDNELAYAIRTLVSEGCLKYQTTGYKNKRPVAVIKQIAGPTSLVTTTIRGKLEDQLDDRMITVHPNTSTMQTRDIIEKTAQTVSGTQTRVDDKILRAYQHFHDSLVSADVVIPFASDIASFVSRNGSLPLSARRSFKRVMSGIRTMTLLYQKQRHRDEQGRFIADYSDYAIAYQLLEESFAESLGEVKRHTDGRIRIIESEDMITPRALSEKTGVSVAAISQWTKQQVDKGALRWCDELGEMFEDENMLEKAKRSGKAYLCVTGNKSLPSPYQLTGDPRWNRGGEFYAAYDLQLDAGHGDDQAPAGIESHIEIPFCGDDIPIKQGEAVKVLSVKSHDQVLKITDESLKNQKSDDFDEFLGEGLPRKFCRAFNFDGLITF